jgi:S-adenosylmethionine:tRNA ribosyltransferase-isomerase
VNAAPVASPPIRFDLPGELAATAPPEARGIARDQVRLLVGGAHGLWHGRFTDLLDAVRPGDLMVVNNSATLAAAVDGVRAGGAAVTVHVSGPVRGRVGTWVVELRRPDRAGPVRDAAPGERVRLPAGAVLELLHGAGTGGRLWHAHLRQGGGPVDLLAYLFDHGRPIRYGYVPERWPLRDYQTVFATVPGSAEMPSAGRPFSTALVTALVAAGVGVAPVTLHTGVSSPEAGEPPLAERFEVPEHTAGLVNLVREGGGRVIAVGTTVARALESVATPEGRIRPGAGWTDLVLGPHRPVRVVDGLVTGFHPPEASHLLLLTAVAGDELVRRVYRAALQQRYRWHEFGDACLLLGRG